MHLVELSFSHEFNHMLTAHIQNEGNEEVVAFLLCSHRRRIQHICLQIIQHLCVLNHLEILWSAAQLDAEKPASDALTHTAETQVAFLMHLEDLLKGNFGAVKDQVGQSKSLLAARS